MKYSIQSFLLIILLTIQSLTADVFHENINQTDTFEQLNVDTDWDSVVANDHWYITQVFNPFTVVPCSTLWTIFRKNKQLRSHLWKTIVDARNERQELKGVAANIDCIIQMEPALQPYRDAIMDSVIEAHPRYEMIAFYQKLQALGIPIRVATNNDYKTLMHKSKKLNARLTKAQLPPFTFDGAYCAGQSPEIVDGKAPDGMPAGVVAAGKDSDEYFELLYKSAEKNDGANPSSKKTLFIFNDDKKRNVERARNVARKMGIPLLAVHRNKSDQAIVHEVETALKKYAPKPCEKLGLISAK